jgi:hypothetical protein
MHALERAGGELVADKAGWLGIAFPPPPRTEHRALQMQMRRRGGIL